jgi:hypothetical protein
VQQFGHLHQSLNADYMHNMLNTHLQAAGVRDLSARAVSASSSGGGSRRVSVDQTPSAISADTQLILWQQQMLTTSLMQQQLHQQQLQMQHLQAQLMHQHQNYSLPPSSQLGSPRVMTPMASGEHAYPLPPAMLPHTAYPSHPLSSESLHNLFTPYTPYYPTAVHQSFNASQQRFYSPSSHVPPLDLGASAPVPHLSASVRPAHERSHSSARHREHARSTHHS